MLGSEYLCGVAGQYSNAIVVSVRERKTREGITGRRQYLTREEYLRGKCN